MKAIIVLFPYGAVYNAAPNFESLDKSLTIIIYMKVLQENSCDIVNFMILFVFLRLSLLNKRINQQRPALVHN